MDLDVPTDPVELVFEVCRSVRDLDDPVRRTVGEPALGDRGILALDELLARAVPVVNEEHPPIRPQTVRHQRPERREAFRRNVRQPEPEEHYIVATVRPPTKQISQNEAHPLTAHPGRGDVEHLSSGVHGRDLGGVPQQLGGPGTWTAGEFEHAAGRPERIQRFGQLTTARKRQRMVVVLGSNRPIERGLLVEQPRQIVSTRHPSSIAEGLVEPHLNKIGTPDGRRYPLFGTTERSTIAWLGHGP
jgi:hypothetical protein